MTTVADVAPQSQIDPGKILTFPQGIPGFEKYTKFNVFHKEENNISAYWLESCDSPQDHLHPRRSDDLWSQLWIRSQ